MSKYLKIIGILLFAIVLIGFCIPERPIIPVDHATTKDWDRNSFWQYPWGKSGTHKGIDIFAPHGTVLRASTSGIVTFEGELSLGGIAVSILGPKWKVHYYAHLSSSLVKYGDFVQKGEIIGYVGTTGNAVGKPPHLHYSIATLFPYLWRYDGKVPQGWKKIFYLDPDKALRKQ